MTPSPHPLLWLYLASLYALQADAAPPVPAPRAAAQEPSAPAPMENGTGMQAAPRCLSQGEGYLRARISGAIQQELDWGNEGTLCTGAVRPAGAGIRMRFSRSSPAPGTAVVDNGGHDAHASPATGGSDAAGHHGEGSGDGAAHDDAAQAGGTLVLVFGITGLHEGQSARSLPVNLTVIREGQGQFYSTQGDDKCMLDEVSQTPIAGIPRRSRSYRIVARGFCTEPARAVRGPGAILLSRFDFAGQVDFETEDTEDEPG